MTQRRPSVNHCHYVINNNTVYSVAQILGVFCKRDECFCNPLQSDSCCLIGTSKILEQAQRALLLLGLDELRDLGWRLFLCMRELHIKHTIESSTQRADHTRKITISFDRAHLPSDFVVTDQLIFCYELCFGKIL